MRKRRRKGRVGERKRKNKKKGRRKCRGVRRCNRKITKGRIRKE
jgi:hypothetical protein